MSRNDGVAQSPYPILTCGIAGVLTLVALEAMGIATVMPSAARELHGLGSYSLAFSGYLTASLIAVAFTGPWTDRRGPWPPIATGMASLIAGLLIAGTASGMNVLIAGRALQGLGSGLSVAPLYAIVARSYPRPKIPAVFAIMSSAWVMPSVIAPAAAGAVTQLVGWRWVFLGLAPLTLIPAALLVRSRHLVRQPPQDAARVRVPALAVLAAVAGLVLVQAVHQLLLIALAMALAVIAIQRLLPPGTLSLRVGLPAAVLARGLVAGAFFGGEAFVPLLLVSGLRISPSKAGLALASASITWAAGSWLPGRFRAPARSAVLGCLLVACGLAVTAAASSADGSAYAVAIAGWAIAGLGMGLALTSVNLIALSLAATGRMGGTAATLQLSEAFFSTLFVAAGGIAVRDHGGAGIAIGLMCLPALAAAFPLIRCRAGSDTTAPQRHSQQQP